MIKKIDHIVITTASIEKCLDFYSKLGFSVTRSGERYELRAGDFKINVHLLGKELLPHAKKIQPGSGDFCFELVENINEFKNRIESEGISVELGTVTRNGVNGEMQSIYLRDPDGNLVEFCRYDTDKTH